MGDLLLRNEAIPLVSKAYETLVQAESLVAEYMKRSHEFGGVCGGVFRAALPAGKTHMPYKDAIGRLNYWFEAMSPLLQSKGLLARLPEIAEARLCMTDKWKREGMREDDFTAFYYAVLKSVANYGDGSAVPTATWDTEPGDMGLLNSDGNPVAASPLYQRTKPKAAKWGDMEVQDSAPHGGGRAGVSMTHMMTTMKRGVTANADSDEDDEDDLFFDMPDDEMDDFDAAQAVFNYMAMPSFNKRKDNSDSDEEAGRHKRGDDGGASDEEDAAFFDGTVGAGGGAEMRVKKVAVLKKPPPPESESSDDEAELQALAKAGVRDAGDDDTAPPDDESRPILIDADGVSRGVEEQEVF